MPRLFALDQNFPQPLIEAAAPYFRDVVLEPIWRVDRQLAVLEDWELLLALHHHELPFDGLITTNDTMLNQARELEVVRQTNLTLVVVRAAGHDDQGDRTAARAPRLRRLADASRPTTGVGVRDGQPAGGRPV